MRPLAPSRRGRGPHRSCSNQRRSRCSSTQGDSGVPPRVPGGAPGTRHTYTPHTSRPVHVRGRSVRTDTGAMLRDDLSAGGGDTLPQTSLPRTRGGRWTRNNPTQTGTPQSPSTSTSRASPRPGDAEGGVTRPENTGHDWTTRSTTETSRDAPETTISPPVGGGIVTGVGVTLLFDSLDGHRGSTESFPAGLGVGPGKASTSLKDTEVETEGPRQEPHLARVRRASVPTGLTPSIDP